MYKYHTVTYGDILSDQLAQNMTERGRLGFRTIAIIRGSNYNNGGFYWIVFYESKE